MTSRNKPGRAAIVGTGLIGGSLGLALRARGWTVTGTDSDDRNAARALEIGAIDAVGDDPDALITFIATPVGASVARARLALEHSTDSSAVTDVAGVKAAVCGDLGHPRFVGGHPMAGSEQIGLDGADPDLFVGATWVLTPTASTDAGAYSIVRQTVTALGAEVVSLSPEQHDALVAVVSHVPHLTAATLMNLADKGADKHAALLRLAAGGFRDMTRVAAGHPGIWPDVCAANSEAIVATLDELVGELSAMRDRVAEGDRAWLLQVLERAAVARRSLPAAAVMPERLAEIRIPVPDRPGVLAEITTLAESLGVNISDLEIAHSAEGERGVLVLVVAADASSVLQEGLADRGYRSTAGSLE
jgi:prephenate dehydrogenase